jgi:hypothetical protein
MLPRNQAGDGHADSGFSILRLFRHPGLDPESSVSRISVVPDLIWDPVSLAVPANAAAPTISHPLATKKK